MGCFEEEDGRRLHSRINLFDIRKASWVRTTNIGCVYRTNLWHTTAVREFFRLFLENLMEFSNENYIENVSTIKHQNLTGNNAHTIPYTASLACYAKDERIHELPRCAIGLCDKHGQCLSSIPMMLCECRKGLLQTA